MRLLLDTNIFLEILLDQERAEESRMLLRSTQTHEFFATDFTLHSIGCKLFGRAQHTVFVDFLRETVANAVLEVLSLTVEELQSVAAVARDCALDFDDAYQYAAAENRDLTIVSFDSDFDRTERGRRTPAEVLRLPTP